MPRVYEGSLDDTASVVASWILTQCGIEKEKSDTKKAARKVDERWTVTVKKRGNAAAELKVAGPKLLLLNKRGQLKAYGGVLPGTQGDEEEDEEEEEDEDSLRDWIKSAL